MHLRAPTVLLYTQFFFFYIKNPHWHVPGRLQLMSLGRTTGPDLARGSSMQESRVFILFSAFI